MEVNHIENLQKICRLCGKLDFNNLKSFNFTRNKTDFKKIIRDDDSDKAIFPPKKFCYDCRTNFLSPLASFAFNVQCLKEICSLCGVREKANTGLRAYQFERGENEEELLNMLKQNRNALYPQPKKDKFCGKCRYGVLSELDKARKGKNSFNDA